MENENSPTIILRNLDKSKGEYSYVERKYSEDKNFSFMGADKIESYNDVAFIFKNFQKASVENAFVLHVLPSGKPMVQHLSMGYYFASYIYIEAIKEAVSRFNSKEVYFIHNHPSGNLTPRAADLDIYRKFKKAMGSIAKDGININNIGWEYSLFGGDENIAEMKTLEGNTKNVIMKNYNKIVFLINIDMKQIKNSAGVANFVSAQRSNTGNNLSMLILSGQNIIKANIHLEYSEFDEKKLAEDIILYSTGFGGSQVILYGRSNEFSKEDSFVNKITGLMKDIKDKADINLLNYINIKCAPDEDLISRN
jgi:hypothetical protein